MQPAFPLLSDFGNAFRIGAAQVAGIPMAAEGRLLANLHFDGCLGQPLPNVGGMRCIVLAASDPFSNDIRQATTCEVVPVP